MTNTEMLIEVPHDLTNDFHESLLKYYTDILNSRYVFIVYKDATTFPNTTKISPHNYFTLMANIDKTFSEWISVETSDVKTQREFLNRTNLLPTLIDNLLVTDKPFGDIIVDCTGNFSEDEKRIIDYYNICNIEDAEMAKSDEVVKYSEVELKSPNGQYTTIQLGKYMMEILVFPSGKIIYVRVLY